MVIYFDYVLQTLDRFSSVYSPLRSGPEPRGAREARFRAAYQNVVSHQKKLQKKRQNLCMFLEDKYTIA